MREKATDGWQASQPSGMTAEEVERASVLRHGKGMTHDPPRGDDPTTRPRSQVLRVRFLVVADGSAPLYLKRAYSSYVMGRPFTSASRTLARLLFGTGGRFLPLGFEVCDSL